MMRILFVDDEPNIRDGMRRMLRNMRSEWDMEFAESGEAALQAIAARPFDVVVSDMRMPGMDGAELLARVKAVSPDAVRLILSGHSETAAIVRAVGSTHQYLSKPCDPDVLKRTITRAFALRSLLRNEHLQQVVGRIGSLPSMPGVYHEIVGCLQSPNASLADVGKIISKDIGMTATFLKLVNSAFFGLSRSVNSVERAVSILGLDTIVALVLGQGIFKAGLPPAVPGFSLEALWQRSLRTGAAARVIARHEGLDQTAADDAFLAGILHDLGELVLAQGVPEAYADILREAGHGAGATVMAERALLQTTHAEVGAYLLGLWGLPDSIVEAVAYHENPAEAPTKTLGLPVVLHAADRLVLHPDQPDAADPGLNFDPGSLDALDIRARWPHWQAAWAAQRAGALA